jgi:hypothetical protein
MPLDAIDPPIAAYEAVRSVVTGLAAGAGFRTPALRRADPEALALSTPHRVALLPLDRIRRDASLRAAAQTTGWRFLLHDRDKVVAAADAVAAKEGGFQFGQVNEGPFVAATEEAIRRAERLDAVRKRRFAPVLLTVPALYVMALWLEDRDGEEDVVLALAPAPSELEPYAPITPGAFLAVLAKLRERVPAESGRVKDPAGG